MCSLPLILAGCAPGLGNKLPPLGVSVPRDCENIAQPVPHAAVYEGLHPKAAWKRERAQLDKANDRLDASRECQAKQRESFSGAK